MKCKNCDNDFFGHYCNMCGQKVRERLTIRSVWAMVEDDIFEVNKGLLYTVKQLWVNPGKTSLDYVNGLTRRYYSPLKYLIFWTAIYLILVSLVEGNIPAQPISDLIFNSSQPFSIESTRDFMRIGIEVIFRHLDIFYLGATPFLTITSYLVYRSKKFYFTELSILYLYILGQVMFVVAITIPAMSLLGYETVAFFLLVCSAVIVTYLIIKSHKQFFGETWIKSTVKSLLILYVGQLIYLMTAFMILNVVKAF